MAFWHNFGLVLGQFWCRSQSFLFCLTFCYCGTFLSILGPSGKFRGHARRLNSPKWPTKRAKYISFGWEAKQTPLEAWLTPNQGSQHSSPTSTVLSPFVYPRSKALVGSGLKSQIRPNPSLQPGFWPDHPELLTGNIFFTGTYTPISHISLGSEYGIQFTSLEEPREHMVAW